MTRDEFICEKLGITWHKIGDRSSNPFKCTCGRPMKRWSRACKIQTSPPGPASGCCLRGMKGREDWIIFFHTIGSVARVDAGEAVRMIEIKYIAPDPFANAVKEFFGWEGKEYGKS